jgi:hypothetical protein
MTDRVLIPLPGIGTLELTREAYEAALQPVDTPQPATAAAPSATELVSAKVLARRLSLPISCVYEYARAGRIPCVRAGKHVASTLRRCCRSLRTTAAAAASHR